MTRTSIPVFVLLSIVATALYSGVQPSLAQSSSASDLITVGTDKDRYYTPDTIFVSGRVSGELNDERANLFLRIYNPLGNLYRNELLPVAEDGLFEYDFVIGGQTGVVGTYRVTAVYGGAEAETTFEFAGSSFPKGACENVYCTYNISVNGSSYPINFKVSANDMRSMELDAKSKSIIIFLERWEGVSGGGYITVQLPTDVIDARLDGGPARGEFVVRTGTSVGNLTMTDYREFDSPPGSRTITVNLPDDATAVQIMGTNIMPEFGAISLAILGILISACLMLVKFRGLRINTSPGL